LFYLFFYFETFCEKTPEPTHHRQTSAQHTPSMLRQIRRAFLVSCSFLNIYMEQNNPFQSLFRQRPLC